MSTSSDAPILLCPGASKQGRRKRTLIKVDRPYPADQVDSKKITVTLVRASWDFEARDETELSFKKGDEIIITIQADGGWWMGSLRGKEGKIPINRVVVVQTLEKKLEMKINQKNVTSKIKALQRLVSRDNLGSEEAPSAPVRTSSPLVEKSPIGKRKRRSISGKLKNIVITPASQKTDEELAAERREKRKLEKERRQRAIELEEQQMNAKAEAESKKKKGSSHSESGTSIDNTENTSSEVTQSSEVESSSSEGESTEEEEESTTEDEESTSTEEEETVSSSVESEGESTSAEASESGEDSAEASESGEDSQESSVEDSSEDSPINASHESSVDG